MGCCDPHRGGGGGAQGAHRQPLGVLESSGAVGDGCILGEGTLIGPRTVVPDQAVVVTGPATLSAPPPSPTASRREGT